MCVPSKCAPRYRDGMKSGFVFAVVAVKLGLYEKMNRFKMAISCYDSSQSCRDC